MIYFLFIIPAIIVGVVAQRRVQSTFAQYAQVPASSGLDGATVAMQILANNDLADVAVVRVEGTLTDHYDPRNRTVNLSADVHDGRTISASSVAAHEVGHAIQHGQAYVPLRIRSAIWPLASFATNAWWVILLVGAVLGAAGLMTFAVVLYAAVVIFQLVTLPVEFDASRRAKKQLVELGLMGRGSDDQEGTTRVLRAAAMTYVAAALASLMTLLYYLAILRN